MITYVIAIFEFSSHANSLSIVDMEHVGKYVHLIEKIQFNQKIKASKN